jgi:RNA polymerase sigma factor (sigma-70 family)
MPASPAEIARRALADHLAALPAGQLLHRYAASRDPEAFAALVHQFGPLVLGTCRRLLGPSADADDAFQAVFLALSRQAGGFRDAKALPAWLHRVALRVSRKALARRTPAAALPDAVADPADPFADVAWRDVRRVLDEEVDGLPEKYRGPVVLCWLDGLTRDEAAGRLGLSLNTVARRLDAGRALLRSRLTRRGLAPALATAAVATPTGLRAVVPEALRVLAIELGVGGDVPAGVAAVGVVVSTTAPTRRAALAALLGAGAAAAGGLAYALTGPRRPHDPEFPPAPQPDSRPVAVAPAPRARLGPLRFEPAGGPLLSEVANSTAVLFGRDGRTLISTGLYAPRVWDLTTREPLDVEEGTRGYRQDFSDVMALGPDGTTIVSGLADIGFIQVCDPTLRKARLARLTESGDSAKFFALSPDGNTIATVTPSRNDAGTRHPRKLVIYNASHLWKRPGGGPDWAAPNLAPTPGGSDWRLRPSRTVSVTGEGAWPPTLAFSPDGSALAGAGSGGVWVWDVKTGAEKMSGTANRGAYRVRIAFSPDGRWLASCGLSMVEPGEVKVWDLAAGTGRTLASRLHCFHCLAFHPDGRTLVVGDWDCVTQWDVVTGENRGELAVQISKKRKDGRQPYVCALAFSPDGHTLATAVADFDRPPQGGRMSAVQLWTVTREK